MSDTRLLWTVEEAAELLDPPMSAEQVRTLIALAGIEFAGTRATGRPGRRPRVYDAAQLQHAHAAEARRTSKGFTDSDWIGMSLLARGWVHVDAEHGAIYWHDGSRAETPLTSGYGVVRIGVLRCFAHRIVWMTARGEIPSGLQINHRNGRRWDNRIDNLEVVTFGNNIGHAAGTGYLTYHDAQHELGELDAEPDPEPVEENPQRVGGVFRTTRSHGPRRGGIA